VILGSQSGADEDSSLLGCCLQYLDLYALTIKHGITSQKT